MRKRGTSKDNRGCPIETGKKKTSKGKKGVRWRYGKQTEVNHNKKRGKAPGRKEEQV